MSENIDNVIHLSDQDQEDLAKLQGDEKMDVEYHPVLKVWDRVLEPALEGMLHDPITPAWANKICSTYREVTFANVGEVQRRYYEKIIALHKILQEEIAKDPDCLTYSTAADDRTENSGHYKQILCDWQIAILEWEMSWEHTDPMAGAELAALAEVQQMFFGSPQRQGLATYLETIGFEWTEADQSELAEALEDHKVAILAARMEGSDE